jgi:hypothetical protein
MRFSFNLQARDDWSAFRPSLLKNSILETPTDHWRECRRRPRRGSNGFAVTVSP